MLETKQIEVSKSIENELLKMPKWKLLIYLQENGKQSAYDLSKEFNWAPAKTHSVIKQLEKSNAIKSQIKLVNGRAVKFVELVV
jgi:DNA-binding MarR family transcriptional regulator